MVVATRSLERLLPIASQAHARKACLVQQLLSHELCFGQFRAFLVFTQAKSLCLERPGVNARRRNAPGDIIEMAVILSARWSAAGHSKD